MTSLLLDSSLVLEVRRIAEEAGFVFTENHGLFIGRRGGLEGVDTMSIHRATGQGVLSLFKKKYAVVSTPFYSSQELESHLKGTSTQ